MPTCKSVRQGPMRANLIRADDSSMTPCAACIRAMRPSDLYAECISPGLFPKRREAMRDGEDAERQIIDIDCGD